MDDFLNRVDVQRKVLQIINRSGVFPVQLFGLSRHTITRWIISNGLSNQNEVYLLLEKLGQELFFLATKSQEQVTQEYKTLSKRVSGIVSNLEEAVRKHSLSAMEST